jgi:hypothetical protein
MWSIKKIFHYDIKTGNSYVLLHRNSKPTKNKNSDLIRVWYSKNFPDKKDTPEVLKDKKLGRLNYWLGGKTESKSFEDAILTLMEDVGEKLDVYKPPPHDTIMASGWLPTILPNVTYDLTFKTDKTQSTAQAAKSFGFDNESKPPTYYITGIDWLNIQQMNGKNLSPMFDYFGSRLPSRRVNTRYGPMLLKAFVKKRWRQADWSQITVDNYKTAVMDFISTIQPTHRCVLRPYETIVDSIFCPSMTLPLKVVTHVNYRWLQSGTNTAAKEVALRSKWQRIISNPEIILLQGEDYLPRANINDFKRLCLSIGREIPDDEKLNDLEAANVFIKSLGRRTCQPIQRGSQQHSTNYVLKIGNNWATGYDIDLTKRIIKWLEGIPLIVNVGLDSGSIDLNTQIVLKHPDDKMHWWSHYSYPNVSLERTEEIFAIGNAHNFSQEDWVQFTHGPKPVAIFGRVDIFGPTRGNIFFDYVKRYNTKKRIFSSGPRICSRVRTMTYEEACALQITDAQVYVSDKPSKERFKKFPPSTKLKRKWMYNPKRIVTELINDGISIWVRESDGTEQKKHRILNSVYSDANIICTWESYQMVSTAILLCTEKTSPVDVYRMRVYAQQEVILVETSDGGVPSTPYVVKEPASLINIR